MSGISWANGLRNLPPSGEVPSPGDTSVDHGHNAVMSGRQEASGRARVACLVLVWLGLPILLAIPSAILFYPGEWLGPGAAKGYSFSMDFLSALGRWRTAQGIANPMSAVVFNGALVGCGLLYGIFFWPGRATFIARRHWRLVMLAGGWIMAVGLAGIGLTPYDAFPRIHDTLCSVTLGGGFLAVFSAIIGSDRQFEPRVSRWVTIATLGLIPLAALLVNIAIDGGLMRSRPAMPLLQKGVVSLLVGWTYWQVWLMSRRS